MVGTVPHISDLHTPAVLSSRRFVLALAATRGILEVAAIPLAPALYRDHVATLTLLRPTKEVFLFGGFQVREGHAWFPVLLLAAIPLLLGGVWVFFLLGRAYRDELDDADLPGIAGRLLPKKRIDQMRGLLNERGPRVVFLGRLAAFPSTLMAAAAGASGVRFRDFAPADAAGAIVSMLALYGIGYGLGEAYEEAGPWITGAGVLVLATLLVVLGRALLRSGSGGTATRKA
jgi:membrane protein DedA with SNARE-associated domain